MRNFCIVMAGLFSFILPSINAENLIVGDSGAETEIRTLTEGPWGVFILDKRQCKQDKSEHYDGSASLNVYGNSNLSVREINNLVPGKPYTFSLYAKAAKNGTKAFLTPAPFKRSEWRTMWRAKKSLVLSDKWERYSVTFTPKYDSYTIIYGLDENATAWFDAFQLEAGENMTEYKNATALSCGIDVTAKNGYVFFDNEKIEITFNAHSYVASKNSNLKFKYRINDYQDNTVIEKTEALKLDENGNFNMTLDFKPGKFGWFAVNMEILENDKRAAGDYAALAVVAPPVKIANGIVPFCAMSAELAYPEAERRIGVKWVENVFAWNCIERKKGEYDWNYLHKMPERLKFAKEAGFKTKLMILAYGPDWTKNKEELESGVAEHILPGEQYLNDWRLVITKFMDTYKDYSDMYEIGGEVDAQVGLNKYYKAKYPDQIMKPYVIGPPMDVFCKMLDIASEEIRKQKPDALISAIRPCDTDSANNFVYSREVFKRSGKSFNLFGVDCYPRPRHIGPGCPPTGPGYDITDILQKGAKVIKENGNNQQMFISEYGYFVDYNHITNIKYLGEQLNRLATSFLTARAGGMKVFFYYAPAYPSNCIEAEKFCMSIWYRNLPLPAVAAYSTVAEVVENVTESKWIEPDNNLKITIFKKNDGSAVAGVWGIDPDITPGLLIENDKNIRFTDVMGNAVKPEIKRGKLRITVSEYPIYVWSDNFEELNELMKKAEIDVAIPAELAFTLKNSNTAKLHISNTSKTKNYSGSFKITQNGSSAAYKFDLPANEKYVALITLKNGAEKGGKIDFEFDFGKSFDKYNCSFTIPEIINVPRLKNKITINGSLDDWKDYNPIILDKKDLVLPQDHVTGWMGKDDLSAKVYTAWDEQYFYFAAEVTDDQHFNKFKNGIWQADCVQMAFDPENNDIKKKHGNDPDDTNMALALSSDGPLAEFYFGPDKEIVRKMEYSVVRDEKNKKTIYEAKIPFASLGIKAEADSVFGFNTVFFDDDTNAGQDYYMFMTHGIAGGFSPKLFNRFNLSK